LRQDRKNSASKITSVVDVKKIDSTTGVNASWSSATEPTSVRVLLPKLMVASLRYQNVARGAKIMEPYVAILSVRMNCAREVRG
jgi:hypothetical protein